MVQGRFYKTYIIVGLLLLLVPLVVADEYMLYDIEKCIGKVNVIDRTKGVIGYNIKNCNKVADGWDCKCQNNPFQIILEYDESKDHTFDFVIRHYVSVDKNEDTERIKSIEGLTIGKAKPKKEPLSFPALTESGGIQIFIVIGLILIVFIGLVIVIIKWALKDKGDDDFMNTTPAKEEELEVDDEMEDILNKYG